jgi:radical SAM-linked protein
VSFTGGFHPLPRLQLALSLPLGVEGEGEWLDLEFTQPIDPEAARSALAAVLPPEFRLLSVAAVPVASASLSQELAVAEWRFTLRPQAAGAAPTLADWQGAIDGLLAAPLLLWRDTDKKGRPRERDCRPDLLKLCIVSPSTDELGGGAIRLDLEAAIDPQGRSLRPIQLAHWLGAALGRDLAAEAVVRRALRLLPC